MVFLKSIKKAMLVMSVAYIGAGLLLVTDKTKNLVLAIQVFAGGLVLVGLLSIFRYFMIDVIHRVKREDFIMGALLISIGVVLLLESTKGNIETLSIEVFGMAMCVSGCIKLQDMFNSAAAGKKRYGFYLALFVISVIFGIVVMFSPFVSKEIEFVVIGIGLMICGACDIISNFLLAGAIHSYDKALKNDAKQNAFIKPTPEIDKPVLEETAVVVENTEEIKEDSKEESDEEKPLE